MKQSVSLVLLVALGFGCLSFRKAPPDLSSPKAAVKAFAQAINEDDTEAMTACVKSGSTVQNVQGFWANTEGRLKIEVTDTVAEVEGDKARVAVEYLFNDNNKRISQVDFFALERADGKWRIVVAPDALKNIMTNSPQTPSVLRLMSVIIGSPDGGEVFAAAHRKAQAVSSLSNVKQIGTAAMMYAQDYDEVLPAPASKYKDILMPYIKSEQIFHAPAAPATETVSYSFNKHLEGVQMAAISHPAETIMLYEGKDMKPEYRYEGKTVIGFADGHAKLHTPEQVAKFVWLEKEWKPRAKPVIAKPAPKKKPSKKR